MQYHCDISSFYLFFFMMIPWPELKVSSRLWYPLYIWISKKAEEPLAAYYITRRICENICENFAPVRCLLLVLPAMIYMNKIKAPSHGIRSSIEELNVSLSPPFSLSHSHLNTTHFWQIIKSSQKHHIIIFN